MITSRQELTRDMIFYSVCVSDFEKLDFKNDALAGVRANYFNSNKLPQCDKSEISLEENRKVAFEKLLDYSLNNENITDDLVDKIIKDLSV